MIIKLLIHFDYKELSHDNSNDEVDTKLLTQYKIPQDSDPITSLSIITCSKYLCVTIPLISYLGDFH